MPRKKELKIITGLSRIPEDMLVQKSLPLFKLWQSKLTLAEFKILDTYLARIDSRKPENRIVKFKKGELERLLGVKQFRIDDLEERLDNLMKTTVKIDYPNKRGFREITLFEEAACERDEDGLWEIDLECTQKAMQYFFNIENLGYLRYKLRCVIALSSRYSYILFSYIESNRFRKTWEVSVDKLKNILHCEDEKTYKEFKRFNDRLLKRCHKELEDKTECRFTYEPIKKGRVVCSIRFTVETLPILDISENEEEIQFFDDDIELLRGACRVNNTNEPEFTRSEIERINELLVIIPSNKFPVPDGIPDDIAIRRYHYLKIQYAKLNEQATKRKIKNRFSYFVSMIENDTKAVG